jgi:hypothetical protein
LNNILNRTADLQAAREEPGRLSEGDITRKRDQVNIRTGDVGNDALTYQKLSTASQWIQGMQGSRPSAMPSGGGQDSEYQRAMSAIQQGAPRQAVIQMYEQKTGQKWPGGE